MTLHYITLPKGSLKHYFCIGEYGINLVQARENVMRCIPGTLAKFPNAAQQHIQEEISWCVRHGLLPGVDGTL